MGKVVTLDNTSQKKNNSAKNEQNSRIREISTKISELNGRAQKLASELHHNSDIIEELKITLDTERKLTEEREKLNSPAPETKFSPKVQQAVEQAKQASKQPAKNIFYRTIKRVKAKLKRENNQKNHNNRLSELQKTLEFFQNKDKATRSLYKETYDSITALRAEKTSLINSKAILDNTPNETNNILLTYAHARYGAYIDNKFNKKSSEQQKSISNVIDECPMEIIALSLIAEQNTKINILDATNLKEKLDSPQVKQVAAVIDPENLNESIEQAKPLAKMTELPQSKFYQTNQKYAGRYA